MRPAGSLGLTGCFQRYPRIAFYNTTGEMCYLWITYRPGALPRLDVNCTEIHQLLIVAINSLYSLMPLSMWGNPVNYDCVFRAQEVWCYKIPNLFLVVACWACIFIHTYRKYLVFYLYDDVFIRWGWNKKHFSYPTWNQGRRFYIYCVVKFYNAN